MKSCIGLDPGRSGGMCYLGKDGTIAASTFWEPRKAARWLSIYGPCADLILLEKVGAMPSDGRKALFSFGRYTGMLEAFVLCATEREPEVVTPRAWQTPLGLWGLELPSKTEKKNAHKALAQEFFPSIKMTHALADACLIATYARDHHDLDLHGIS